MPENTVEHACQSLKLFFPKIWSTSDVRRPRAHDSTSRVVAPARFLLAFTVAFLAACGDASDPAAAPPTLLPTLAPSTRPSALPTMSPTGAPTSGPTRCLRSPTLPEPKTVRHASANDHPDRCTNVCADEHQRLSHPLTDLQADGGTNGATIAKPDGDTDRLADPIPTSAPSLEPGATTLTPTLAPTTPTLLPTVAPQTSSLSLLYAATSGVSRWATAELDGRRPVRNDWYGVDCSSGEVRQFSSATTTWSEPYRSVNSNIRPHYSFQ